MCNTQNSFILYTDSIEEVQLLTLEQRGLLLTTAFCYVNNLSPPELDQATSVLWLTWKKVTIQHPPEKERFLKNKVKYFGISVPNTS